MVKNLLAMKRPRFNPWGGKIPWICQPTPVFLPGKSHGQRSLVSYSPWGLKESDMTECLSITDPCTNNDQFCSPASQDTYQFQGLIFFNVGTDSFKLRNHFH